MRGAKFLNCTAKRRQKKPDGANRPVRCVVFMGSFRRVAPVARPSLHRPRCAAPVVPHPPDRRARRFRLPSPLRRIRRAGEHAGSASPLRFPSPLPLSVAPPGCVVPVVAPLRAPRSGWRSRRFRAPSLLHWVAPFVLPLSRRVAPPRSGRRAYRMATCA